MEKELRAPRSPVLIAATVVFAIAAAVYVATMNRTIGFVDRGELAAVATTLGIAHPTGYPTLTLLGHLWVRLVPLEPALALNLLAALWAATGAGALVLLYDRVMARIGAAPRGGATPVRERAASRRAPREKTRRISPPAPVERAALAACGALLTAFTGIWWQQSNGFEVYALQVLLLPLVVWLFLRWLESGGRAAGVVFALVLGLTFTNHVTIGLIAPALLLLYFSTRGLGPSAWRGLLPLVPAFSLGLTPYLYLPLRAAQRPRFDWNAPVDLHHFIRHLTGQEFRGWMFDNADVFRRNIEWFFGGLPFEWAWVGLALIGLGAWRLARADRRLGLAAALLIAAGVVFASNFDTHEIVPDYLSAVLGFGLLAAAGLVELRDRVGTRGAIAFGIVLALGSATLHWRDCDESGNHMTDDLTANTLESLPRNAVLLTTQWDYVLAASMYDQAVRRWRPDVTVIDLALLRNAWYLDELERRAPALVRDAGPEVAVFRRELEPYERGRPYDAANIGRAWRAMIDTMIVRHSERAPVLLTWEIDPAVGAGLFRVPEHLAYRLVRDTAYFAEEFPRYRYRPWHHGPDSYVGTTDLLYGRLLAARMGYEGEHGHPDRARRYGEYALTFAPPWRADEVVRMPDGGHDLALQSIQFFERLEQFMVQARGSGKSGG